MGAEYQDTHSDAESVSKLHEEWQGIVEDAAWNYGHGGYTGSFAEKPPLLNIVDGVWTEEDAREHCSNNNDKWDRADAYKLKDGTWYIGGWCSS